MGLINDDAFDIETEGSIPTNSKVYGVNPAWGEQCKALLQKLEAEGRVKPSNSPWASPAFFKKKPDGQPRFLVDYQELNKRTVKDRDRPPEVQPLLEEIAQKKYFSIFDCNNGYFQMPLTEGSMAKTAFLTQWGCYEFTVMPQGVTNAPAKFQRYMRQRFDCAWCRVFIDNVIIFSDTLEEHLSHLSEFFSKLEQYNITLKASKMVIGTQELKVLGHTVRHMEILPGAENIKKLLASRPPQHKKHLQGFLGLTNYFRKFVPHYSDRAAALIRLLNNDTPFVWGPEQQAAFEDLIFVITTEARLHAPDWSKKFTLETDASAIAIGACLHQNKRPIAFASRTLTPAERNYDTMDRECLAILVFKKQFQYYFEGTDWEILTDNAPIKCIIERPNPRGRHARGQGKKMSWQTTFPVSHQFPKKQ
eukprot:PhF_6_TR42648/c0_g1_i4/m.64187